MPLRLKRKRAESQDQQDQQDPQNILDKLFAKKYMIATCHVSHYVPVEFIELNIFQDTGSMCEYQDTCGLRFCGLIHLSNCAYIELTIDGIPIYVEGSSHTACVLSDICRDKLTYMHMRELVNAEHNRQLSRFLCGDVVSLVISYSEYPSVF